MRKIVYLFLIVVTLIPLVVHSKIETISDDSVNSSTFNAENGNITYSLNSKTNNLTYTQDE